MPLKLKNHLIKFTATVLSATMLLTATPSHTFEAKSNFKPRHDTSFTTEEKIIVPLTIGAFYALVIGGILAFALPEPLPNQDPKFLLHKVELIKTAENNNNPIECPACSREFHTNDFVPANKEIFKNYLKLTKKQLDATFDEQGNLIDQNLLNSIDKATIQKIHADEEFKHPDELYCIYQCKISKNYPYGHYLCNDCAKRIKTNKCPICRAPLKNR